MLARARPQAHAELHRRVARYVVSLRAAVTTDVLKRGWPINWVKCL